jgi:hypothetical protein
MKPVTVSLPLALTADMLRAVRQHPTTSTDDKEEEHRRIGWLLCAWDVIVAQRETQADGVVVPLEALQWLMGEVGDFEPPDAHLPQPTGHKLPTYWWRSEFQRRAGLV